MGTGALLGAMGSFLMDSRRADGGAFGLREGGDFLTLMVGIFSRVLLFDKSRKPPVKHICIAQEKSNPRELYPLDFLNFALLK
jgi:hypothetical protein